MGSPRLFEPETAWFSAAINPLACTSNVWFVNPSSIWSFGWTTLNWNLLKASHPGIRKTSWIDDTFPSSNDIRKVSMEKPKFPTPTKWKGGKEPLMPTWWVSLPAKSLISGTGKLLLVGSCMVPLVFRGHGNWTGMFRRPITASACCTPKLSFQLFTRSIFALRKVSFTSSREVNCFG